MKWVIFAIALAGVIPLSQWLRKNPAHMSKVWVLFGLLPFAFNAQITMIDWAGWPGYSKGFQVTGLDLLAFVIFINLPRARRSVPFRFEFALYFFAVAVSVFVAQVPMAAIFYVWQVARVIFIYVVVTRASTDERVPMAILKGMTIGLCYQAALTIWQRFGLGMLQTTGTFGHQNLLGLATEFAIFPLFALLLAGKKGWPMIVAPTAGMIIAVLTTSRGAIGFAAIGYALVFIISIMRGWTARKALVLMTGVVAIVLLAPVAIYSFEKRFSGEQIYMEDERALFENASSMMLSDHPFGVGANNFNVVANNGGYYEKAGVPWGGNQRNSMVHNVYWLTAVETGYLGFFAFALLMLRTMTTALRCSWQYPKDQRGDLLLGLGVSLLIVAAHLNFDWGFMFYNTEYMLATTIGLTAGLAEQLGYWRSARPRVVTQQGTQLAPERFARIRAK